MLAAACQIRQKLWRRKSTEVFLIGTRKQTVTGGVIERVVAKFQQVLASGGEQFERHRLTDVPLTVVFHPFKKPFVYTGFINFNTDGHGFTRMKLPVISLRRKVSRLDW
jgi:hypothetical protein